MHSITESHRYRAPEPSILDGAVRTRRAARLNDDVRITSEPGIPMPENNPSPSEAFAGFSTEDLGFLSGLAANNDKAWFTAHRAVYEEGLKPAMGGLITALNREFAARDLPFVGDVTKSVFRIHRDVRFSKDKRPYKTHISASLTREGDKMAPGAVYVHVEPEGGPGRAFDPQTIDPLDPSTLPSAKAAYDEYAGEGPFVTVGFYLWDHRPLIDAFRKQIVADPKAWLAVEKALDGDGLELEDGAPVKRMPKGFEDQVAGPLEAALKKTQWLVGRRLTGAELADPNLPILIADFAAQVRPLFAFGWRALQGVQIDPKAGRR
jgi:uncharacterized protein (DUF2461 family)